MIVATVRLDSADLAGPVDQLTRLGRVHAGLHELGDVAEQQGRVDLLLEARAEGEPLLLPDDRHHRLVVELRVVQAVEQVDGAATGGGHAAADLAGELRVATRHERAHLLVARLDQLRVPVSPVQRAQEAVDPVARVCRRCGRSPIP